MRNMGTVTDADAIYYYFEILKNIGKGSILDAGMFLKRIGAVARQVMGCEVSANVLLCGIDFFPEVTMELYREIYDEMLTRDQFFRCGMEFQMMGEAAFDVAVLLETEDCLSELENTRLWEYAIEHSGAIMAGQEIAENQTARGMIKGYYPVSTGARTYAWIPLPELKGGC